MEMAKLMQEIWREFTIAHSTQR